MRTNKHPVEFLDPFDFNHTLLMCSVALGSLLSKHDASLQYIQDAHLQYRQDGSLLLCRTELRLSQQTEIANVYNIDLYNGKHDGNF